jgi:sugar porter (SP) family MFS transporter
MADVSEKQLDADVEQVDTSNLDKTKIAAVKIMLGNEAFNQAMIKEPPIPFNAIAWRLYLICLVSFFCSTSNGFDSSLFGTLLTITDFKNFMDVGNVGIGAGIVTSMNQIGGVVAIPFIGPAIDTFGRRAGMFTGGLIIIIGVILQGTCVLNHNVSQFMGGRFFMGMGVSIIASAGPCYCVEIAHPAYRGIITAFYNVFWPIGALVASCSVRGSNHYGGHTQWLVPLWIQLMFPSFVFLAAWFLPESPRWLYTNGKMDQAKATLAKYHGNGNLESEWVKLQMFEYETYLELEGADKRWWDYRALFKDRASRYRLMANCVTSIFGQWAGNGVVSYFLAGLLDTAGIHSTTMQQDLAVIMNAVQCIFAFAGGTLVDRVGRRPLLICANAACSVCWIAVTAASGVQASRGGHASTAAMVSFVYIFQVVYSLGWTPLQALYPVEVLSFEMRAKGMAFSNMFVTVGGFVNQFGFPVAMAKIKWKTYFVFIFWCAIQAIVIYFVMPETKNRTLEELDEIFHAPNPVKASIAKKKLELDENKNVVGVVEVDKVPDEER